MESFVLRQLLLVLLVPLLTWPHLLL